MNSFEGENIYKFIVNRMLDYSVFSLYVFVCVFFVLNVIKLFCGMFIFFFFLNQIFIDTVYTKH